MECFATKYIGKFYPVGHYYGTILYNKTEVPWNGNVLVEGLVSGTKHDIQNWSIRPGQKFKCSDGQIFNVWLFWTKFNYVRSMNDPRSMTGRDDDTSNFISVNKSPNVMFEQTYCSRGEHSR